VNRTQLPVRDLVGLTVVITAILFTFAVTEHPPMPASAQYKAVFRDIGDLGLRSDVTLHGARIGAVSAISLSAGNSVITFTVDANQRLGSRTAARISAETPTHVATLTLHSLGNGTLAPGDTIPAARTNVDPPTDEIPDVPNDARQLLAPSVNQRYEERAQRFCALMEKLDELTGFLSENSLRTGSVIINPGIVFGYLAEVRTAIPTTPTDSTESPPIRTGTGDGNELNSALWQQNDADTRVRIFREVIDASLSDLAAQGLSQR